MLYTRSSFLRWLKDVQDCEIIPLEEKAFGTLRICNGPAKTNILTDRKDRIDYEEIQRHCQKLYLLRWPDDSELERLE